MCFWLLDLAYFFTIIFRAWIKLNNIWSGGWVFLCMWLLEFTYYLFLFYSILIKDLINAYLLTVGTKSGVFFFAFPKESIDMRVKVCGVDKTVCLWDISWQYNVEHAPYRSVTSIRGMLLHNCIILWCYRLLYRKGLFRTKLVLDNVTFVSLLFPKFFSLVKVERKILFKK